MSENITITNSLVSGFEIGSLLDGLHVEDADVSNITMRNVSNAPIFIRLGRRMRAPDAPPVGSIKRITISNVVAYDADPRYAAILISGIPGHDVENVALRGMFGILPASGFFMRHAAGIALEDIDISYLKEDRRSVCVLDRVSGIELEHCKAAKADGVPTFVTMKAKRVKAHDCAGLADLATDVGVRAEK